MKEKFNHLYLDSHERKLLIHSLVDTTCEIAVAMVAPATPKSST